MYLKGSCDKPIFSTLQLPRTTGWCRCCPAPAALSPPQPDTVVPGCPCCWRRCVRAELFIVPVESLNGTVSHVWSQWLPHRNHVPPERERSGGEEEDFIIRNKLTTPPCGIFTVCQLLLTDNLWILKKDGGKEIMLSGIMSEVTRSSVAVHTCVHMLLDLLQKSVSGFKLWASCVRDV